jgi:hypothetical protein
LWFRSLANGVANLTGIRWLDQKWKWRTIQKLYSSICSISGRAKPKGEEGMKIISNACRSYKSKLVKLWMEKESPFCTYKELREEDWARFIAKCELENCTTNSQYMQWLWSQNGLDHHLDNTGYDGK